METKKCNGSLCKGEQQDINLFNKNKFRKDGLTAICKKCKNAYDKKYRERTIKKRAKYQKEYRKVNKDKIRKDKKIYAQNNKDKIALNQKKYHQDNKERLAKQKKQYHLINKNKLSKQKKIYYENNKKYMNEASKKYRQLHGKELNANRKLWALKNIDKQRAYSRKSSRKRRALAKNLNENYTLKQEQITLKAFNNRCLNCGSTEKLHIDHHRPLSKGHPLTLENAVVLCKLCNGRKHDQDPEIFYGIKKCKQLDRKLKKLAQLHSEK